MNEFEKCINKVTMLNKEIEDIKSDLKSESSKALEDLKSVLNKEIEGIKARALML